MILAHTPPLRRGGAWSRNGEHPGDMKIVAPPTPPRAAVIWDVGGTLVDRAVGQAEALAHALGSVGLRLEEIDDAARERAYHQYLRSEPHWCTPDEEQQGFEEVAAILLEPRKAPGDPDQIARLGQALGGWDWVYRPVPGIPELLQELGEHGVRQAVASNWPPSLPRFLRYQGLHTHFAVVVGSGAEGCRKPDPRFYQRVIERLEVGAGDAVFIGNDPDLDILPARAAGLMAIHFDPRRQHAGADAHDVPTLRQHLLPLLGLPTAVPGA
jgi:putative hydrolase of the HAD superfamily